MKRTKRTIIVICMIALMMMFAAVPAMAANTGTNWTLTDTEDPDVTINITISGTGNNIVFNLTMFVYNEVTSVSEPTISVTVPGNDFGSGTFNSFVTIGGYTIYLPIQGNNMSGKDGDPKIIDGIGAGHNWVEEARHNPACTVDGYVSYKCTTHGDRYTQVLAALNHDWDGGVVTTSATCVNEGLMTITCQRTGCNATKTEEIAIDPDNHDGETYEKVITDATCDTAGEMGTYCEDCDALLGITKIAIDPKNHVGETYEDVITAATCDTAGVMGTYCEDCDALLSTTEIAKDPKNHVGETYEDVITAATCDTVGVMGTYCEDCDALLSTIEIAKDPKNHVGETYEDVITAATCDTAGVMGTYCEDCDALLGTTEIAKDPKNHVGDTYEKEITAATCDTVGEMGIYCEDCDALLSTEAIPAIGHSHVLTGHKDATYYEDGYDEYTCSNCGDTYTVIIPQLTVIDASVASYNKNLQDKSNQNLVFAITVTLSDGATTLDFQHAEKVNGGQKGTKTFTYDEYTVVVAWNDNNKVTSVAVTLK